MGHAERGEGSKAVDPVNNNARPLMLPGSAV